MPTNVKKSWVDPLTFREIKVGDRVKLNSENDITLNLIVDDIYDDDSLLLRKPEEVIISGKNKFTQKAIVLSSSLKVSGKKFSINDKVIVKLKNGKTLDGVVLFIIDNSILVIGPKNLKNRPKILKKLLKL